MAREGIRGKAEKILDPIIRQTPIRSDELKGGEDLYQKYTRVSHETLKNNWNTISKKTGKPGQMTGCNAFVGEYSRWIGTLYLGGLYTEDDLRKGGMHHAWVKSTSDVQPQYGDICQHAGSHVSVSLDFKGGTWYRLNAGQGGRGRGFDVLDVSSGPWEASALKGWVDLEAYFASAAKVPDWLQGWWQVAFRGDTYYYYIDLTSQAKWSEMKPRDTLGRMLATDGGVGTVATKEDAVTIRWRSGSVEKFTRSGDRLDGTWNDTASISAVKMD